MSDRHPTSKTDTNKDGYTSGVEQVTNQGGWSIHFQHVPSGHGVFFEAFLTSFQDAFRSAWSEEDVYGRMDPIATFQNTKRTITFGFDVLAESGLQAEANTHKFQHLSSFLYPAYEISKENGTKTLAAPPLIKIKFANLIQNAANAGSKTGTSPLEAGLIGYVDGFSYTPKLEMGFVPEAYGVFHPIIYSVDVNFKVLHSHDLGWDASKKKWIGAQAFPNATGAKAINANVEGEKWIAPINLKVSEKEKSATQQDTPGKAKTKVKMGEEDALLNRMKL
tara:strand:- start:378 stop:1211 length:834 start_codon:yes stop_codon:yes gene_type:complete